MRLDRLLSNLAIATRSESKALLKSGRIRINGLVQKSGDFQVTESDRLEIDGQFINTALTRHLMLYKPADILTAAEDSKARTVMDLLPPLYRACGCMPIGRLDKDTTGILLLTTDGELAHRLLSPLHHVNKVYRVYADAPFDEKDVELFQKGIDLGDFTALPAVLCPLPDHQALVTVQEGKYHQVKRMVHACGKNVLHLHRESFGSLHLDENMQPGNYRELTEKECAALYEAAGLKHE